MQYEDNIEGQIELLAYLTETVLKPHAEETLKYSQEICPVKTGFLRSTGVIEPGPPGSYFIGYTAPYAIFVEKGTRFMAPRAMLRKALYRRFGLNAVFEGGDQ